MSLINDALKRASTNPKPAASIAAASEPAMVAVTAASLAAKPRQGTSISMIVGMIALTVIAGWFFLKWREASSDRQTVQVASTAKPAPAPAGNVQTPAPAPPVAKTPAPAATAASKPSPPPVAAVARPEPAPQTAAPTKVSVPVIAATPPVAIPQPPAAPAAAPATPQPMPELKLQAIVFRMKNPSALINGRHVEVGDDVSGARVAEIQRTTVFVEWQGQRQPLQMK